MIGYIRDPRNWSAVKSITVISYDIPLESAQGKTGEITFVEKLEKDYTGFLFTLDNYLDSLFKIGSQSSSDENISSLTVLDQCAILGEAALICRTYNYPSNTQPTRAEELLIPTNETIWLTPISEDTISRYDRLYESALPDYYSCLFNGESGNAARTAFRSAITSKNIPADEVVDQLLKRVGPRGSYEWVYSVKLKTTFYALMRYGFYPRFSLGKIILSGSYGHPVAPCLYIDIRSLTSGLKVVNFDSVEARLISQTFDDDIISHVAIQTTSLADEYAVPWRDYYLSIDGAVTAIKADQVQGDSTTKIVDYPLINWNSGLNDAQEIFSHNTRNHKIVFDSDIPMHIGQPVRLMLPRGAFDTTVSEVSISNKIQGFRYTCGDLPVTGSEKLRAFGWSYGRRLPLNPRKGKLHLTPDGAVYFDGSHWVSVG